MMVKPAHCGLLPSFWAIGMLGLMPQCSKTTAENLNQMYLLHYQACIIIIAVVVVTNIHYTSSMHF